VDFRHDSSVDGCRSIDRPSPASSVVVAAARHDRRTVLLNVRWDHLDPQMNSWRRRIALCAVAAPFVVAIVSLIVNHWGIRSFSDDAIIELRTREAFSTPILVGQVSRLNTRALGPLWNYLAAAVYWLFGGRSVGMYIAAAVLNCACSVAAVGVMWKRQGARTGLAFALAIFVMTVALGPHVYADHWNPHPIVFALPLLFALAWSVADGHDSDLVWMVLVASYSAQTHLSGVVSCIAPIAAAIICRLLVRPQVWPSRAHVLPALAVGLVAWAPPILETVLKPPGNLARVGKFLILSRDHRASLADGVRVATSAASIPPNWISGAPDVDGSPGLWRYLSASLMCLLIGVVIRRAVRLRRRRLVFPLLASGTFAVVMITSVWRTIGDLLDYTILWTAPAAMLVWFAVSWAAVDTWRDRVAWPRSFASRAVIAPIVAAFVAVGCFRSIATPIDAMESEQIIKIAGAIRASTSGDRPVVVDLGLRSEDDNGLGLAVVVELIKDGRDVVTPGRRKWFDDRDRAARPGDQVVQLSLTATPATVPTGADVLYDDGHWRVILLRQGEIAPSQHRHVRAFEE
jgi:hypothetical protein